MSDTEKQIVDIIVDMLGVKADQIKPDTDVVTDLGADSLDCVEIIIAVEDRFNVEITDKDAEGKTKVSDMVAIINEKLKPEIGQAS